MRINSIFLLYLRKLNNIKQAIMKRLLLLLSVMCLTIVSMAQTAFVHQSGNTTTVIESDGTIKTYIQNGNTITCTDNKGNISMATTTGNVTTFTDNKGNISTATKTGNVTTFTDNKGNISTVVHSGNVLQFQTTKAILVQ